MPPAPDPRPKGEPAGAQSHPRAGDVCSRGGSMGRCGGQSGVHREGQGAPAGWSSRLWAEELVKVGPTWAVGTGAEGRGEGVKTRPCCHALRLSCPCPCPWGSTTAWKVLRAAPSNKLDAEDCGCDSRASPDHQPLSGRDLSSSCGAQDSPPPPSDLGVHAPSPSSLGRGRRSFQSPSDPALKS